MKRTISLYISSLLIFGTLLGVCLVFVSLRSEEEGVQDIIIDIDEETGLPLLSLQGTPAEIGRAQGRAFKYSIQKNINNLWANMLVAGLSREEFITSVKEKESALQPEDPDQFIEIHAMAEAAGVPYYDLLAFNLYTDLVNQDDGCTAWIAHGTASANGKTIFHKNRDESRDDQVIINLLPSGTDNGYKAIVTAGETGVSMGINTKGLCVGNTYVYTTSTNWWGKGSLTVQREMLLQCDTVDEAIAHLDEALDDGMSQGACLFLADASEAWVIEHTGYQRTAIQVINGVDSRSNHYRVRANSGTVEEKNLARYLTAQDFLEANFGSLDVQSFNELSRNHIRTVDGFPSEHQDVDGSICNYHTLSGGTFEIDPTYPGELSVMWTALGTPCTAIYVPIHVNSLLVNAHYVSSDAWSVAETLLAMQDDTQDFPFGSLIPHYEDVEAATIQERETCRNTAFAYLQAGQTSLAQQVLTNFDNTTANQGYLDMIRISQQMFWEDSFHYLNGIESLTNIAWDKPEEAIKPNGVFIGTPIVYNFAGITSSNTIINMFENDVDVFPCGGSTSNRNDHTEPTDTEYTYLATSDDVRWETDDPGDSDEMMLWMDMVINEPISEIETITFTFEGYSSDSDAEQSSFYMYLLKKNWVDVWQNTPSWIQIGNPQSLPLSGGDQMMTYTLTWDFGDYINDDGTITWAIGTPNGHSDSIFCDYVKIEVQKTVGGYWEYDPQGVLTSTSISLGSSWQGYRFYAVHEMPSGTNIVYKILDSSGSTLCTISATQAVNGYDLTAISSSTIKLSATLTTSTTDTPVLQVWRIVKET